MCQFLFPLGIDKRRIQIISPVFIEKTSAKTISLLIGSSLNQQFLQVSNSCLLFRSISLAVFNDTINLTKQRIGTLIIFCIKQTGKDDCHKNQNNFFHSAACIISAKIKVFQKLPAFRRRLLQVEKTIFFKERAKQIYYKHNNCIYNNQYAVIVNSFIPVTPYWRKY